MIKLSIESINSFVKYRIYDTKHMRSAELRRSAKETYFALV